MSNALTQYLGNADLPAISEQDMAGALAEVSNESGNSAGMFDYLSFSGKSGQYSLGRKRENVDTEQLYIMDPLSVIAGWTCWKASKPIAKHEWSVYNKNARIEEGQLEDHAPYNTKAGDGWAEMRGFSCFPCDQIKGQVNFTTTSKSGRNAVYDLTNDIAKRAAAGEPTLPVFYFESESFVAQDMKNFKPKFEVEAWVTRDAVQSYVDGDITAEQLIAGDAPKKKRK
jgi:hypothetical protein